MLRMTVTETNQHRTTLSLEGRIVEGLAQELRRHCVEHLSGSPHLVLDVSNVSFIDEVGIETLRHLTRNHVQIVGCSMFVSELIERAANRLEAGFTRTSYAQERNSQ